MKKNNFFIAVVGLLLGTHLEVHSSEGFAAVAIFSGLVVATTVKTVKNTATYQTYSQHQGRLALEQEESDNPWLHAQELPVQSPIKSVDERIRAFEQNYKKEQEMFNKRLEPVIKKNSPKINIIDDYSSEKK